ncbi:hypothetical protein QJQ45_020156 [Haematococcus lacustris]|nr:hypothetical protein QJQ45_020156 [Haematococcus lacustris]
MESLPHSSSLPAARTSTRSGREGAAMDSKIEAPFTTETIQKAGGRQQARQPRLIVSYRVRTSAPQMLEDNYLYIKAIVDQQNLGRVEEMAKYQSILQDNLMKLASLADSQPGANAGPAPAAPPAGLPGPIPAGLPGPIPAHVPGPISTGMPGTIPAIGTGVGMAPTPLVQQQQQAAPLAVHGQGPHGMLR